jgi:hypothetical protein
MQAPVPTIQNESTLFPEFVKSVTSIRNLQASAINYTTIWDPAAGKSIRIMGIVVSLSRDAATATEPQEINICVDTTATPIWIIDLNTAGAFAAGPLMTWNLPLSPQGYLCPADGVLKVWLYHAFSAGLVNVCVYGGEE